VLVGSDNTQTARIRPGELVLALDRTLWRWCRDRGDRSYAAAQTLSVGKVASRSHPRHDQIEDAVAWAGVLVVRGTGPAVIL